MRAQIFTCLGAAQLKPCVVSDDITGQQIKTQSVITVTNTIDMRYFVSMIAVQPYTSLLKGYLTDPATFNPGDYAGPQTTAYQQLLDD